jgi:hypothetical protein
MQTWARLAPIEEKEHQKNNDGAAKKRETSGKESEEKGKEVS